MKREAGVIIIALLLACSGSAQAGEGDEGKKAVNKQKQGQQQGQQQGQKQGQAQGQLQGQIGVNKATGSGNETSVSNHEDVEVLAPTWAPTPSTQGKEESKIYTLWGGVDSNEISRDKRVDHHINVLKLYKDAGLLTMEEYKERMLEILDRLENQNASKRVLGLLWKTEGRHVANGFGLLAFDDLRGKLQRPTSDRGGDTEITGNAGNF